MPLMALQSVPWKGGVRWWYYWTTGATKQLRHKWSIIKVVYSLWSNVSDLYTAISRKVVGKNVHATIPKGNMGYDQYSVPDFVAVEPTFVAFL